MTAPLVVVAGTGTGIGKTTLACALVAAWTARRGAVAGVKPIESGGQGADVLALERVSTFHVTRSTVPYLLAAPVSPHLAARREGVALSLSLVTNWTTAIRAAATAVVLELPGGLFTPLTDDGETNIDLVRRLDPTRVILVAPDRLGVLHDVIAATLAARAAGGVAIDAIVLSEPEAPDASTTTNAAELRRALPLAPIIDVLPRCHDDALAPHAARILDALQV